MQEFLLGDSNAHSVTVHMNQYICSQSHHYSNYVLWSWHVTKRIANNNTSCKTLLRQIMHLVQF